MRIENNVIVNDDSQYNEEYFIYIALIVYFLYVKVTRALPNDHTKLFTLCYNDCKSLFEHF